MILKRGLQAESTSLWARTMSPSHTCNRQDIFMCWLYLNIQPGYGSVNIEYDIFITFQDNSNFSFLDGSPNVVFVWLSFTNLEY